MSAHISFHGPYTFAARFVPPRESDPDGYVEFMINADGYTAIYLRNREQADALVCAALTARDLLPETAPDPDVLNDASDGAS